MATFQTAGQAEIIRSSQKDQIYQTQLRGSVHDVVQSLIGTRFWVRWRKELDIVSDCLYFGLTTIAGFQTLGEEYVNILQVDSTKRAVPSVKRRIALITLHIGAPYLLDKTLARLSYQLEAGYRLAHLSEEANNRLRHWLPALRNALSFVDRVHMAVFYLRGLFYHIAKRFSGVHYIQVRRKAASQALQKAFHILGWLSAIQLGVSLLWHALQLRKMVVLQPTDASEEKERYHLGVCLLWHALHFRKMLVYESAEADEEIEISSALSPQPIDPRWRCSLCLERLRSTTCPPCGHLFCWNCIMEWCRTKPECPICRSSLQASRLVRLQNYDKR